MTITYGKKFYIKLFKQKHIVNKQIVNANTHHTIHAHILHAYKSIHTQACYAYLNQNFNQDSSILEC